MQEKRIATYYNQQTLRFFDDMLEGILILDEQMNILYANKSYLEYSKLNTSQLVGHYLPKVHPGAVSPTAYKTQRPIFSARRAFSNGSESYVDVIPLLEEGEVIGAIVVVRDIKVLSGLVDKLHEKDQHISRLQQRVKDSVYHARFAFDDIIGVDEPFFKMARKAAGSDNSVLLFGESGTGKEVMAQAIHNDSDRSDNPFVDVNCAALPEGMLESELFGYAPGAFTGANRNGKMGLFEMAQGGTIFLDEIAEMPFALQGKLLRVLQERKMRRLGDNAIIQLDVRVIAATNKDIQQAIEERSFREDLFYRLAVVIIQIPPLRERPDDLEQFIVRFLQQNEQKYNRSFWLSPSARKIMLDYPWPGNVRQLQNAVEYSCMVAADGNILPEMLPHYLNAQNGKSKVRKYKQSGEHLADTMDRIEKEILLELLQEHGRSVVAKKKIAESLGIGVATLYYKLQKHGIT